MDYGSLLVHTFDMCQFDSYKFCSTAVWLTIIFHNIYYNCGPPIQLTYDILL